MFRKLPQQIPGRLKASFDPRHTYSWGDAVEATADCPAGTHKPPYGKAERLLGYASAGLLRFSTWRACKTLVNPCGYFLSLFYAICILQS